ncbi:MAG: metal-dependent hydrolase [Gammaproteobacteria bacterium]
MDSVTQIALGATIAGAFVPAGHRRRAMALGAALGTLPDLDVFIDFGGAVENYTYHRGFSHSLFVLAPFAVVLWLLLRRWWAPVRAAPGRWFAAIFVALVTHPLLDAHTAYGTQLWWPLGSPPVSWSTLFIIDPLYTLPLVIGGLVALGKPRAPRAGAWLMAGLLISSGYIGWSWAARSAVEGNARTALAQRGLENAPVFLVPTPFNTLLWRVVVMTPDGYLEGLDSLVADDGPIRFRQYTSDVQALEEASTVWAVRRLRWFARDFLRARVEDETLFIADLRMGQEPYYVFRYAVARKGNPHWQEMETRLLPDNIDTRRALETVWRRIWSAE